MRGYKFSPGLIKLLIPLIGLALVAVLAVPVIYRVERSSLKSWSRKTERFVSKERVRNEMHFAGLGTPPTVSAAKATLADDEPIIGIEAAGKFRAYHQRAMNGRSRHVINDVLGGKAVTVTYCDVADCARAFGGVEQSGPLNVAVVGIEDGRMLVNAGSSVAFFQDTAEVADPVRDKGAEPFPHPAFPLSRTTWAEWKSLHPETDLYVYDSPPVAKTSGR